MKNTVEQFLPTQGGVCADEGQVLVSHPLIWPEYMVFTPVKARDLAMKLLTYANEAIAQRLTAMEPGPDADEEQMYDPARTYTREDNAFWDGTDAAHPAWWRGNDRGSVATADKLRAIAEGGPHTGVFGGAEVEAAAQAILKLRRSHG